MAQYLVTGGCGFIGSHLVDALIHHNHQVTVIDNLSTGKRENLHPQAQLIIGDIIDVDLVKQALAQADGCFHLAAIASVERSTQEWLATHQTNLAATINLFEQASRVNKSRNGNSSLPVIYASSAAVYGDNKDLPLAEQSATKPLTAYGADKLGCELHASIATKVHQVPTIGLRFFNVFGPRQDPKSPYSGVISIFFDHLKQNQQLTIYGDGEQNRDFIYVGDVVKFLLAAMQHPHQCGQVYNVCSGNSITINDLAKTISEVIAKPLDIQYQPPRVGDIHTSLGNPYLANTELNITAQTTLRNGLQQMTAITTNQ